MRNRFQTAFFTPFTPWHRQARATPICFLSRGMFLWRSRQKYKRWPKKTAKRFFWHCACEALKNERGLLRVYIRCSGRDEKKNRIVTEYRIPERDAEKMQKHYDKKRTNYYYANTAKRWDDMKNYDLVLDSAVLGTDGCVKVIKSLIC